MRIPLWRVWLPALVLLACEVQAAPGDLDPTFGNGGIVSTTVGTPASGRATVLQPDGNIVVAGASNGAFLLVRYLPDGSLDPDFGSGGVVTTPIGAGASAAALILQPDGKLVAAGTSTSSGQASFALVRYDDDGALDASFGSGGIVTTSLPGATAYALARQADGKLVAAGTSNSVDGGAVTLLRYEADGSLDATFGTAGVVTSLGPNADAAYALAVQPDQKLVVGGEVSTGSFMFARYDTGGVLDPTFGAGGVAVTNAFNAVCRALAIQPDGKIVGVGSGGFNGYAVAVVVRIAADGTLDSTFVTNQPAFFPSGGVRMYSSAFGQNYQVPRAVAVDTAGRIVFAGTYAVNVLPGVPHVMYAYSFYAARLNADGTEDSTFGLRNWAAPGPGGANALLLQPDHKAVAVGTDSGVGAVRFLTGLCGNGIVDAGETCDDANGINGDGCDGNCRPTGCGNGMVTAGESCDDGNVEAGDCCDAVCAFESAGNACPDDGNVCTNDVCGSAGSCIHPANSNPCDDGNDCTVVDTCEYGTCQGSPPTECPICEACAAGGGCVVAPRPACAQPPVSQASRLKIKDKTPNKGDQVQWQWLHGSATTESLGDPLDSDDYALCVYDQSGGAPTVAFSARIPGGGQCGTTTCWRSNAQGFKYKNKGRTPDGVQSLALKAGTGKAQIRLQAAGDLLNARPGGLPAPPLALPLVVQLQAASGACWEAAFSTPSTNEAGRFDAKSD